MTGKTGKRRTTRGVLWMVALMLIASGGLRMLSAFGPALAATSGQIASAVVAGGEPEEHVDETMAGDEGNAAYCGPESGMEPEVANLLRSIRERQAQLDARDAILAERQATIALAEAEISRNLEVLQAVEERLAATLAIADRAAEDDISRLTTVYENMKPKDAAALFEEMEPAFAAGFLGRMRPDAAAAVMAGLTPQSAHIVSVVLAGRNANAPKD